MRQLLFALFLGPFVGGAAMDLLAAPAAKKVHVAVGVDGTEEEADRYLAANRQIVQKDVPEAVRACARDAEPSLIVDFEMAVEVGKGGKAGKTVSTPTSAFTGCVAKRVQAFRFTEPPRAPLGVYFEVSFGE